MGVTLAPSHTQIKEEGMSSNQAGINGKQLPIRWGRVHPPFSRASLSG